MLKKAFAFVICALMIFGCLPVLASAETETEYLLDIDFSKYADGTPLSEVSKDYPGVFPSGITSANVLNKVRLAIKDGMLEVYGESDFPSGTGSSALKFSVASLGLDSDGQYYIESEFVMGPVEKQFQYILASSNYSGSTSTFAQLFCGNLTAKGTGMTITYTSPVTSPGNISPAVTVKKNSSYRLRHLLNLGEMRFDGMWAAVDGAGLTQRKVGSSESIPYRYRTDTGVKPMLTEVQLFAGGGSGATQKGDLLYKIKGLRIWESDASILSRAAESLTAAEINHSSLMVTGDLTLPSALNGFDGVEISWNSDKPAIVGNDGTFYGAPADSEEVQLTATLTRNGVTHEKTLTLFVQGYAAEKYYLFYDNFLDTGSLEKWEIVNTGGKVAANSGMTMTKTNDAESSCMATYYFQDKASPFQVKGDITFEVDWAAADGNEDAGAVLLAADGSAATSAQFSPAADGYDLAYAYALSGDVPRPETQYAHEEISGEGTVVSSKIQLNTDTAEAAFWTEGVQNPAQTVYTATAAEDINAIAFYVGGANSNRGTLTVKNLKVSVPNAQRLSMNKSQLTWQTISNESASAVTALSLPQEGAAGVKIEWQSSKPERVSPAGVVNRGETDEEVTLTAKFYKEEKPEEYLMSDPFTFTVKGVDASNLAYKKTVTTDILALGDSQVSDVTDGSLQTAFVSDVRARSGFLRIDLGSVQNISTVRLYENTVDGNYIIKNYTIQISEDGEAWTEVADGSGIGAEKAISLSPQKARFVRLNIESKASGSFSLAESEVFYDATDDAIAEADRQRLADRITACWPYIVTSNLRLPTTGAFGSVISWSSNQPSVIADDGTLGEAPASDTAVVLTATIQYGSASKTLNFNCVVQGTGSNSNSNSSQSSSGNKGSSPSRVTTGSSYVPSVPTPSVPDTDNTIEPAAEQFSDLESVPWASEAIESLFERGVVKGDGDGKFSPGNLVTREEFVKMLVSAFEISLPEEPQLPFTDCAPEGWYCEYIAAAFEAGLINGVDSDTFGLGQYITREDMMVMLYRAIEKAGSITEPNADVSPFIDSSEISSYALEAVGALHRAGILNGDGTGYFRARDNTTRAETAVVLYRIIK